MHPLLRRLHDYFRPIRSIETSKTEAQGEARLAQRVSYDLIFATIFLSVLHGTSAIKVFLILYLNYTLATSLPRSYIPAATWTFNIAVLFANEVYSGYPYSRVAQFVPFGVSAGWGTWLESYGGLIPRWEILFNITALRLISFNLDYYWSLEQRGSSPVEVSIDISQSIAGQGRLLIYSRRNNSIQPISLNAIDSPFQLQGLRIISRTTSHTPSTHRYTSRVRS